MTLKLESTEKAAGDSIESASVVGVQGGCLERISATRYLLTLDGVTIAIDATCKGVSPRIDARVIATPAMKTL